METKRIGAVKKLTDMLADERELEEEEMKDLRATIIDFPSDKEEKDITSPPAHKEESTGAWVYFYVTNVHRGCPTVPSYVDRLKRDMQRMQVFMGDNPLLKEIPACKILRDRVIQMYQAVFKVIDEEAEAAVKNQLYIQHHHYVKQDDLISTRASDDSDDDYWFDRESNVESNVSSKQDDLRSTRSTRDSSNASDDDDVRSRDSSDASDHDVRSKRDAYKEIGSLRDLILGNVGENELGEVYTDKGLPSSFLTNLKKDIASELARLHKFGIIHGNLTPENIFVVKLDILYELAHLHKMGIGPSDLTSQNIVVIKPRFTRLISKTSDIGKNGCQHQEVLPTEEDDLFSLGRILFFCISRGKIPNRVLDKKDLSLIGHIPEAVDLISRLLNSNPKLRPKAEEVIGHPFFWDSERWETFLHKAQKKLKGPNSQLLKALEGILDCKAWNKKIDPEFLEERNNYRLSHNYKPYNFHKVRDLLGLIRNSLEHYEEFSEVSRRILGSYPEGVLKYFSIKFPKLFIGVYNVILEH